MTSRSRRAGKGGSGASPGLEVFILGGGGLAREIQAYYETSVPGARVRLVDDHASGPGVISTREYARAVDALRGACVSVMGAGKVDIKRSMLKEIRRPYGTFVHPAAHVIRAEVGEGCVVAPGAVIAPQARLGAHVLVNYNATVGHDARVGDLAVVGPLAAIGGRCTLGRGCYIGSGATIRENLTVGENAVVGMGAVVTKDVPPNVVAVGVPARWRSGPPEGAPRAISRPT